MTNPDSPSPVAPSREEAKRKNEQIAALHAFARWALDGYITDPNNIGDLDGYDLEQKALELGLLRDCGEGYAAATWLEDPLLAAVSRDTMTENDQGAALAAARTIPDVEERVPASGGAQSMYAVRALEAACGSEPEQMRRLAKVLESDPHYAICEAQWLRGIAQRIDQSDALPHGVAVLEVACSRLWDQYQNEDKRCEDTVQRSVCVIEQLIAELKRGAQTR
jgi:hypothetical protein